MESREQVGIERHVGRSARRRPTAGSVRVGVDPEAQHYCPTMSWQPDGWDEWSQTRRRLWRREQQLAGMRGLRDGTQDKARLDLIIEHLEREVADLREQLAKGES